MTSPTVITEVAEGKASRFRKRYRSCNRFAKEKSLTVTNIL